MSEASYHGGTSGMLNSPPDNQRHGARTRSATVRIVRSALQRAWHRFGDSIARLGNALNELGDALVTPERPAYQRIRANPQRPTRRA